jgi:hypothetical protein
METIPQALEPGPCSPKSRYHTNADGPPELSFLDDPDADIIVRSGDFQEVRTLRVYLIKYSPVLNGLIQSESSVIDFPRSPTSLHAGALPYIQLAEHGTILSSLLSFILPVPFNLPSTTEEIMELLSVAQKYEMDSTLAHIRVAIGSQEPPFIRQENAFHIYSLAQKYGLDKEVSRAARMALTFPMTIQSLEDKFDAMPGAYFHSLWKYYQRVRSNLSSDLTVFRTHRIQRTLASMSCSVGNTSGIPAWIDSYIASIVDDPAIFSLSEFHMSLTRHLLFAGCTSCRTLSTGTISIFWKELTAVVHNSMANVSISEHNNSGERLEHFSTG